MLIPSIDLMEGKIVQLVQGSRKALEFDDLQHWIDRFSKYPLVQVIDLDAAMGRGNNQNWSARSPVRFPARSAEASARSIPPAPHWTSEPAA